MCVGVGEGLVSGGKQEARRRRARVRLARTDDVLLPLPNFSTACLDLPLTPSPRGADAIDVGAACACAAGNGRVLRQGSLAVAAAAMDILGGRGRTVGFWFVCVRVRLELGRDVGQPGQGRGLRRRRGPAGLVLRCCCPMCLWGVCA